MSIKEILFPEQSRAFKGKRWFDIVLRTIHQIGLMGIAGGVLFDAEKSLWFPYFITTIVSGLVMLCLSLWSNGKWMLQNRGLAIIFKFIMLLFIPIFPDHELLILFVIVIISGFSSHAPARFRYYSPILGREL